MKKTYYDQITSKYEKELFDNLNKFVKIPSVYSNETKSEKNPFGIEVSNALDFIYKLATKDGFKATNYDNMIVEIIAGDETKKNVTVMAHADVVPVGEGWNHDPFDVNEKDGVLYGRGVADDKGPLLSAYYGLLALKENNLINDYCVRFLVGGNEESGSLGMEHYFHTLKKKQPDLGFSPDSAWPLTYGEKGILGFEATKKVNIPEIISIDGGLAANAVIEKCVVEMKIDEGFISFLDKEKVNYSVDRLTDKYIVTFFGKSAHGSVPWLGINAGLIALDKIGQYYHNDDLKKAYQYFGETRGKGINLDSYSEDMGTNSLCVGFVKLHNNELHISINFRFVNTITLDEVIKGFENNCHPFTIKCYGGYPVLFYPKDSLLISTLMDVYQEESGDYDNKPITSGGGTYAKEADNVVAFGMEKPGWDSYMHAPNERVEKSNLIKSMAIYAHAIYELGNKLK